MRVLEMLEISQHSQVQKMVGFAKPLYVEENLTRVLRKFQLKTYPQLHSHYIANLKIPPVCNRHQSALLSYAAQNRRLMFSF